MASIGIDVLPEASVTRLREDAALEHSVLDALTDVALTACADTEDPMRLRLIGVLSQGMQRPAHLNLPAAVTGSNFSHVCLQKLHVLCSRGAQAQVGCLQEVAQLALPVLLGRCRAVLQGYLDAEMGGGVRGGEVQVAPPALEEVPWVLVGVVGVGGCWWVGAWNAKVVQVHVVSVSLQPHMMPAGDQCAGGVDVTDAHATSGGCVAQGSQGGAGGDRGCTKASGGGKEGACTFVTAV